MFSKILIANRGEIACRVMRTAKRMGIATVAVYSEADAEALHVRLADEAIAIGPPAAAESYLRIERILDAIKRTGAEAVHPGYGFLSENRAFAEALDAEGIAFIGPPASAIEAMGDKIQSKKLAQAAGVNSVPGHLEAISDPEEAVRIAEQIGYPVMLKASAGGGGKGMRIARDADGVREGLVSAANEARSSFADDRVFVEKFIEQPRHIEIQILADKHGNCIHLGERECSIQRRHQKVIEEAPSPIVDADTRARMGAQAIALAQAVDYCSAGTVEFIMDANKEFYFLEMNTRLQVEHPVTEMITGLDLVEQMLRVAAGERLQIAQEDVAINGWAIESRVYAEDPYRNFMPSTGRLVRCRPPAEDDTVRIDTGVIEGSEITLYYDPMIAKLVTYGHDRAEAVDRMGRALDAYHLKGISHNVGFLSAVVRHERFRAGELTTAFIEEEYAEGFAGAPVQGAVRDALMASACLIDRALRLRERSITTGLPVDLPLSDELVVRLADETCFVTVSAVEDGCDVAENGRVVAVRGRWQPGQPVFSGSVDGVPVSVDVEPRAVGYRLRHGGADTIVAVHSHRRAELAALMLEKPPADTSRFVVCPMPGLVVSIGVSVGEEVKAGLPVAVVEAMKMENVLRAERDGVVKSVLAKPGDSLSVDQVIVEFE